MRDKKNVLEWIKTITIAMIIAFTIENLVFSFAIVKGESMLPTLRTEDRLLVSRVPTMYKKANKGELIIFRPPNTLKKDELFIKRVIALENDYFIYKDGSLYINGIKQKEKYVLSEEEFLRNYKLLEGLVPKDNFFVMGDNRNNSNDSRSFGFVPRDKIKGKVILKIWPIKEVQAFINPSEKE